jgi:hypothetical protein
VKELNPREQAFAEALFELHTRIMRAEVEGWEEASDWRMWYDQVIAPKRKIALKYTLSEPE